jgi:hypothetical protein
MKGETCSLQDNLCTEVEEDIYGSPDLPLSTEEQRRVNWGWTVANNDDSGESDFDEEAAGCKSYKYRQYFYLMTPKQWAKFTGHAYIPGKKRWRWLRGLNVLAPNGLEGGEESDSEDGSTTDSHNRGNKGMWLATAKEFDVELRELRACRKNVMAKLGVLERRIVAWAGWEDVLEVQEAYKRSLERFISSSWDFNFIECHTVETMREALESSRSLRSKLRSEAEFIAEKEREKFSKNKASKV